MLILYTFSRKPAICSILGERYSTSFFRDRDNERSYSALDVWRVNYSWNILLQFATRNHVCLRDAENEGSICASKPAFAQNLHFLHNITLYIFYQFCYDICKYLYICGSGYQIEKLQKYTH